MFSGGGAKVFFGIQKTKGFFGGTKRFFFLRDVKNVLDILEGPCEKGGVQRSAIQKQPQ